MDIRSAVTPEIDQKLDLNFPMQLYSTRGLPQNANDIRGRRTGALVRLRGRAYHPPLSSILLTNAQSFDKVEELKARISFQRDIRDCKILCFTESWLSLDILSPSIQPAGFKSNLIGYIHMGSRR